MITSAIGQSAILVFTFLTCTAVQADEVWEVFETRTQASLRGLVAVSKEVAWACGSQGTIVQTIDGGRSWLHRSISNLQAVEVRSIHAWNINEAIVATAGQPALILKTIDRGVTWKTAYENKSPQAFFDGMKFWNDRSGVAFSDPIDGGLLIVKTDDGGDSWYAIEPRDIPKMESGEAGFAASNSSLHAFGNQLAWIGLGGGNEGPSRVFRSPDEGMHWTSHLVPPIGRGTSSGIFAIAFENEQSGIAVGGDYNKTTIATQNIAITDDGGLNWREPRTNHPRGFRSSVVAIASRGFHVAKTTWLTCGPSGCDWSSNGEDWSALSDIGFHVMSVAPDQTVWAAGSMGRIAILNNKTLQLDLSRRR